VGTDAKLIGKPRVILPRVGETMEKLPESVRHERHYLFICPNNHMKLSESNLVRSKPQRCDECAAAYVWSYHQTCQEKTKSAQLTSV
jgi:ferredoxin-like protein FixX